MSKMCIDLLADEKAYTDYLNNLDEKSLTREFATTADVLEELKYQYRYLTAYLYVNVINESKNYSEFYKKNDIDKTSYLKSLISHLEFVRDCSNKVLDGITNIYSEFVDVYYDEEIIERILENFRDIKVFYERILNVSHRMDFEIYSSKYVLGEKLEESILDGIKKYPPFVFGIEEKDGSFNLDKRIEWFYNLDSAIEVIEDMTL